MKNGYNVKVLHVEKFNNRILAGGFEYRNITSKLYLFYDKDGNLKKYGYVAFSYDNAFWGKTKDKAKQLAEKYNA